MRPAQVTDRMATALRHIRAEPGQSLRHFPDFLIAGPPRTGSTWLFTNLYHHPDIQLPKRKEVYYLNTLTLENRRESSCASLAEYLAAFRDPPLRSLAKSIRCLLRTARLRRPHLIGDPTASNATIEPTVIRDITLLNPDVRVVIVLRDPIERAWSHAKKDLVDRHNRSPDEVGADAFDRFFRAAGQMHYNRYATILANWRGHLQPGHLLAAEFRLVREDPGRLLRQVIAFLGCRHPVLPARPGQARRPINATTPAPMPESVRRRLTARYENLAREYSQTLTDLAPHRIDDGCHVM